MPNGYALLVGLKSIDPLIYDGLDGTGGCWGCELDVENIGRILRNRGFSKDKVVVHLTQEATAGQIITSMNGLAVLAESGDLVVIYRSGHGGQVPDVSGDEVRDGLDETWILYDGVVLDDQIWTALCRFREGVRIVMISDACHSATDYRGADAVMNRSASSSEVWGNGMDASMIHFGGCRDSGYSAGYISGGAFTKSFCKHFWKDPNTTYIELFVDVSRDLARAGEAQRPTFRIEGKRIPWFPMEPVFKI